MIPRFAMPLIPWGRVGIAASILAVTFLAAAWKIEERRADKLQAQVVKWQTAFGRISSGKNEQKVITKERIVEVEVRAKDADVRAKRIEAAPLLGQCATPEAVMGADI
ncbi:hypothetical protein GCM10022280_12670 [Sphingomonas swuensis]|uniref:Uncharacterized protein n=1 Tax=Sphingomonas swuensis TaxID=977800 RepID=A0ABP7SS35_9SPHN